MPPSLDLVLGPVLMGTIVNVFLFGIMVVQCYLYYLWFKQDRIMIKLTVLSLLILDAVSSALDIAGTYQYLVTSFGNLERIGVLNVGITPYPLLSGVTSLIVQCFFAWRISIITQRNWMGIIICVLSIVQMLASIGTTIGGNIIKQLVDLTKVESVALVWLFTSIVTDLLITIVLVFYLRKRRSGFTSTDDVISKMVRLTVQTGLLTSACAIAVAVAYLVSQSSMHLAFGIPLSKLYTNSLLSTLNMRQGWNSTGYTTLKSRGSRKDSTAANHSGPGEMTAPGKIVNLVKTGDTTTLQEDSYELGVVSSSHNKPGPHGIQVHTEVKTNYDSPV